MTMNYNSGGEITRNRNTRLDSIKGLLILLVVIGHLIEHYLNSPTNVLMYLGIYSFHMPLFILLSGYFFNPHQSKEKLFQYTIILIETFIIFDALNLILKWYENGDLSFNDVISPVWVMWYLLSLIIWRLITYQIFKTNLSTSAILLAAACFAVFAGFIPLRNELALQRTVTFYPFFLLGLLLRDGTAIKINTRYLLLSIALLSIIAYSFLKSHGYSVDIYKTHLWHNKYYEGWLDMLLRIVALSIGFCMSIIIYRIFPNIKVLAKIGTSTLEIYLLHIFVVKLAYSIIDKNIIPSGTLYLILYSIIITSTIYLMSNYFNTHFLLNPVSVYIKKKTYRF